MVKEGGKMVTKEEAIKAVPSYIVPPECFIWNWTGAKDGWGVIPGTGCAHYVAHEHNPNINLTSHNTKHKCYYCKKSQKTIGNHNGGRAIRVTQVRAWARIHYKKPKPLKEVCKNDIWLRIRGKSSHSGIVESVTYEKSKQKIEIRHCKKSAGGVTHDIHGTNGVKGGLFYGPPKPPLKSKFLGNKNTTEVHNLNNEQTNCQINEIKDSKKFESLKEAHDEGYDNCHYCLGDSKR